MRGRHGLVFLCLQSTIIFAHAAEIASNGAGGGPWTDPATWRGKKTPGPDDDVAILKNDVVIFDRADDGKATCRKLQIDPKGGLTFRTNGGKLVLAVSEGIESLGVIRADGTKSPGDDFEIRLTGETAEKRIIKLQKGGALLLYGKAELPAGRCNVNIISPNKGKDRKDDILGLVDADGPAMIDWQHTGVQDVKLNAKKIDNTGAKANERIKLADCRFTGQSRIALVGCDTPEISRNSFGFDRATPINEAAINVHTSPLAEIKGNAIHGGFIVGITVNAQSDSVLIGNTVEKCTSGITGGYGIPNTMIKQTKIAGCETGVKLEGATGVLEELVVDGATTAFHQQNSSLQLTQFQVKNLAKNGVAVFVETGSLSVLNCDLKPEQFKAPAQAPVPGKPPIVPVTCLQYVVVGVKDAPADSVVEVRTANPAPAGAADPNVRNSPAAIVEGLTPLPKSLNPIIVKSWSYDTTGKLFPAPEYNVTVLGAAPKEGVARPVLKAMPFRPTESGYRAAPNDKTPTLEVPLK